MAKATSFKVHLSGLFLVAMVLGGAATSTAAPSERLTVFAAASLRNVLDTVAANFEVENGIGIDIAYAGTSALARQIESGAPADVFISASLDWMRYLEERDLIEPGSRREIASNQLVLISHRDGRGPRQISTAADFEAAWHRGRMAMAFVDSVPAGQYGKAVLEELDLWDQIAPSIVQTDNVRAALALVVLGEAETGIVYKSDVVTPDVFVLGEFDPDLLPRILYPAGIVAGKSTPASEDFLAYLSGPEAFAVFQEFGFGSVE